MSKEMKKILNLKFQMISLHCYKKSWEKEEVNNVEIIIIGFAGEAKPVILVPSIGTLCLLNAYEFLNDGKYTNLNIFTRYFDPNYDKSVPSKVEI
jgi:hypothetical protein